MPKLIVVEPLAHGWAVRHEEGGVSQVFRSGAKAEAAALSLGARLALAGIAAEIRVYLRNGALGGRFLCPAAA
jgi:hypothetical protein